MARMIRSWPLPSSRRDTVMATGPGPRPSSARQARVVVGGRAASSSAKGIDWVMA